jgi:hypothetical protein
MYNLLYVLLSLLIVMMYISEYNLRNSGIIRIVQLLSVPNI